MDTTTNIHTFDISNLMNYLYTGFGRVNGTILDQFSISEYQGIAFVPEQQPDNGLDGGWIIRSQWLVML